MATDKPGSTIKLDWSKLLGFDQATRVAGESGSARPAGTMLAKLGSKIGGKVGNKQGLRRLG